MTQDGIIPLPQYLNASYEGDDLYTGKQLIEYAKLVAAKEREACALICERVFKRMCPEAQENEVGIEAELIRARGNA